MSIYFPVASISESSMLNKNMPLIELSYNSSWIIQRWWQVWFYLRDHASKHDICSNQLVWSHCSCGLCNKKICWHMQNFPTKRYQGNKQLISCSHSCVRCVLEAYLQYACLRKRDGVWMDYGLPLNPPRINFYFLQEESGTNKGTWITALDINKVG